MVSDQVPASKNGLIKALLSTCWIITRILIDFIFIFFCICNSAAFYCTVFYIHIYFTVSVKTGMCMFSFRLPVLINLSWVELITLTTPVNVHYAVPEVGCAHCYSHSPICRPPNCTDKFCRPTNRLDSTRDRRLTYLTLSFTPAACSQDDCRPIFLSIGRYKTSADKSEREKFLSAD